MSSTLLTVGVVCLVAAIVGGGLTAFAMEVPIITSRRRQLLLGLFGMLLLAGAFATNESAPGSDPQQPAALEITGSYQGPPGRGNGMPSTMYCGNDPESWVRASARLDRTSGILSIVMQLETDSTTAGPKGQVKVTIQDANGASLATATSDEIGTGGKTTKLAAVRNYASTASVMSTLAQLTRKLYIEASAGGAPKTS